MKTLTQTVNLMGLMVSAFAIGYIVGLNPALPPASSEVAEVTQQAQGESFIATVSAYCAGECCCAGSADGITANGHRIKPGEKFVAADKRFAFGTMLEIPDYGTVPVIDRGGKIKGDKIDVFFDDDPQNGLTGHQRALEWGVKHLVVEIERRNPCR